MRSLSLTGSLLITGLLLHGHSQAQSSVTREFKVPDASFTQVSDSTLSEDLPQILYRDKPSTLVWIDGDPVITIDTALRMYRILNTPNLIIKNHNDRKYYLYTDQGWYVSDSATNGYAYNKTIPPVIRLMDSLVHKNIFRSPKRPVKPAATHPQVVVSAAPALLIYTAGKPIWANS